MSTSAQLDREANSLQEEIESLDRLLAIKEEQARFNEAKLLQVRSREPEITYSHTNAIGTQVTRTLSSI